MKRTALALAPFAVILPFVVSPAQAQTSGNAPWCAVRELGTGEVHWDCNYSSARECAPTVVAGNRGFCSPSPYWVGPPGRWGPHHRG